MPLQCASLSWPARQRCCRRARAHRPNVARRASTRPRPIPRLRPGPARSPATRRPNPRPSCRVPIRGLRSSIRVISLRAPAWRRPLSAHGPGPHRRARSARPVPWRLLRPRLAHFQREARPCRQPAPRSQARRGAACPPAFRWSRRTSRSCRRAPARRRSVARRASTRMGGRTPRRRRVRARSPATSPRCGRRVPGAVPPGRGSERLPRVQPGMLRGSLRAERLVPAAAVAAGSVPKGTAPPIPSRRATTTTSRPRASPIPRLEGRLSDCLPSVQQQSSELSAGQLRER